MTHSPRAAHGVRHSQRAICPTRSNVRNGTSPAVTVPLAILILGDPHSHGVHQAKRCLFRFDHIQKTMSIFFLGGAGALGTDSGTRETTNPVQAGL